jgi:nucleoside-diphosphate kinase
VIDGERSLCLVKPDGVQRKLIGVIIGRLEGRGLKIVGLKLIRVDYELAHQHYGEHEGKPFFDALVDFITSGPVVALVLQGKNAVTIIRETMGTTDPAKAALGTIRGDLAVDISRNLIHGSDSPENALKEISLFFEPDELLDWASELDRWIIESG